jgi:tRNA G37 N-methylase Trm5
MMHIHEIGPKENMATELLSKLHKIALGMKRQADLVSTRTIKTYNPRYNHYVLDIELNNK